MPYLMISTLIRLESGPTIVGDENADPELMAFLGAEKKNEVGNDFQVYQCADCPRVVLDKLELKGWKVVAVTGASQTIIWTLHSAQ
ncbi:GTP cyclohydrolase 1 feedback regulatory protein-like [Pollicipes pollicipes]|uniref:GTP cyclohydrolase 1 feedback regulatory protein-like n=1 Tax=Pollicipes pollicipes TaxID=41117 RepID=UPI0018849AE5|nr:GTP cyclohydrolase 1 feedback regulatory protein-like [Pollicipes pollicipes]XP_037072425.1 GTP cyclohydrolase 1 feedback regulatory protein-like [Pollicipes pollicipes]XP_037072426.1 GTP cyclohydrolase 1 feedback regulatory protein-like [Pollicipes pollicipes]